MPGNIRTMPVYGMNSYDYEKRKYDMETFTQKLRKDDTYISIFGAEQNDELARFQKLKGINILHISKKSVNGRPNHGTQPRNTVVVYELADDQQVFAL